MKLGPVSQRALFKYLDNQHMDLVANYQLVVVPWSNQSVIDHFNQTGRAHGLSVIRDSLLDTCILTIPKLLLDGDDTKPVAIDYRPSFLAREPAKTR